MAIFPVIRVVAAAANVLEDLLPVVVAAIAGTGVLNVVRRLQAKKRAALLAADPGVRDVAATLRAGVPDEATWGAISAGVEGSLRDLSAKGKLSPADLKRVEVGLHQPNASGQRRLVAELVGGRWARAGEFRGRATTLGGLGLGEGSSHCPAWRRAMRATS